MVISLILVNVVLLAVGIAVVQMVRHDRRDASRSAWYRWAEAFDGDDADDLDAEDFDADEFDPGGFEEPVPDVLDLMLIELDVVDDAYLLDGVLAEDVPAIGPAGWPVTVRLHRTPASIDAWMHGFLARWAEDDAVIQLRFRGEGADRRVAITDGSSTLHFGPDSYHRPAR